MKKMKRALSLSLGTIMAMSGSAYAQVGDVIGTAYNTDIVAYINHYAIPSYAVNGTSCVIAEDLRNFGFSVVWDADSKSLNIEKTSKYVKEMSFTKDAEPSSKFADLLETDISVYAGGQKLTSYAMNGYTMIPLEELTMFGSCYWVEGERALKLWVDDLGMRSEKQTIIINTATVSNTSTYVENTMKYYSGSELPDYTSVTGVPLLDVFYPDEGGVIYIYEVTYEGEHLSLSSYLEYIMKDGWKIYKKDEDDHSIRYFMIKGGTLIGIRISAKYEQVWISLL